MLFPILIASQFPSKTNRVPVSVRRVLVVLFPILIASQFPSNINRVPVSVPLDERQTSWRCCRKGTVKFRFSIRAHALLVVYVASITRLYKIGVWGIRTYHP